jgi:hypothetical protein
MDLATITSVQSAQAPFAGIIGEEREHSKLHLVSRQLFQNMELTPISPTLSSSFVLEVTRSSGHLRQKKLFSALIGDQEGLTLQRTGSASDGFAIVGFGTLALQHGLPFTAAASIVKESVAPILGHVTNSLFGLSYLISIAQAGREVLSINRFLKKMDNCNEMERRELLKSLLFVNEGDVPIDSYKWREEAIAAVAKSIEQSMDELHVTEKEVPKKSKQEYLNAAQLLLEDREFKAELKQFIRQVDSTITIEDPVEALGYYISKEKIRLKKEMELSRLIGPNALSELKQADDIDDGLVEAALEAARALRSFKLVNMVIDSTGLVLSILGMVFTGGLFNLILISLSMTRVVIWLMRDLFVAIEWHQAHCDPKDGLRTMTYFSLAMNVSAMVLDLMIKDICKLSPELSGLILGVSVVWMLLNIAILKNLNQQIDEIDLQQFEALLNENEKTGLRDKQQRARIEAGLNKLSEHDRQAVLYAAREQHHSGEISREEYLVAIRKIQSVQNVSNPLFIKHLNPFFKTA